MTTTTLWEAADELKQVLLNIDNELSLVEELLEMGRATDQISTIHELVDNTLLLLNDIRKQVK